MPVKFTKLTVAAESYESAGVWDVDGDGIPDIVSGSFWHKGPDFRQRFFISDVNRMGEYWNDFATIHMDISGSGRMDFVTGGWGGDFRWVECPADPTKPWTVHPLGDIGNIETIRAADVDGDGHLEIVPNTPGKPVTIFKRVLDAKGKGTGKFVSHVLKREGPGSEFSGHGLGFGDIAGNGRTDILLCDGWLEAPEKPYEQLWKFHKEYDLGCASVPIIVADVNGDGLNDLIVGQAHNYGLDWYEQRKNKDGTRSWIKHPIDPFNSQYHDLIWADIDGDGKPELVTGKRFRAHCGHDPGEFDDLGVYYFKWNGTGFAKQVISYGQPGIGAGCGIHFALADLRGTGRIDVVAPGKDGLHVFFNEGSK
jgi:hypothetical protein